MHKHISRTRTFCSTKFQTPNRDNQNVTKTEYSDLLKVLNALVQRLFIVGQILYVGTLFVYKRFQAVSCNEFITLGIKYILNPEMSKT